MLLDLFYHQKLLNETAAKQAEIELKGQQMSLKTLESGEKLEQTAEKDDKQLTLKLMESMTKITEKEEKLF